MRQLPLKKWSVWLRPFLLISLGLHSAILYIPISAQQPEPEEPPEEEEETVKISQLPSPEIVISPTRKEADKESKSAENNTRITPNSSTLFTTPSSPRRSTVNPPERQSYQPRTQETPRVVQERSEVSPSPAPNRETTKREPSPVESEEDSNSRKNNSGENNSEENNSGENNSGENNNQEDDTDLFKNFPIYPRLVESFPNWFLPTKYKDYAQGTNDPLNQVASFYQEKIPEVGFKNTELVNNQDSLKILKVTHANSSQYLHLLSVENTTVIMLLSEPVSQTELARLQNIKELSPEQRLFEEILVSVYEDFNLEDFSREDLVTEGLNFSDQEAYEFRGRIPQNQANSSQVAQQLEQELISRLQQESFTPVAEEPEETEGAKSYSFMTRTDENINVYEVIFAPVKVQGVQTVGIITTRQIPNS